MTGTTVRDIEITDGRVRVTLLGQGRPLLFLHGISARGRAWRRVAESFVSRHPGWRCWLPDLLGRGDSDARPELPHTLDDEVRRMRELIRALAPDGRAPRLVAGHSQGAALALALAGIEPGVRGLLLASPVTAGIRRPVILRALRSSTVRRLAGHAFGPLHGPIGRLVLRRAGGPAFRASPALAEAYARPWAEPRRARALMRILADWSPADLASRMPGRPLAAHVVTGGRDPRIPVQAARRLAAQLECGFTLAPEGGHVLTEQHPGLLTRRLAELAARVSAA